MKVWLLTSKDSEGRRQYNECVVLKKPQPSKDYDATEFTLVGSPEQKIALNAQAEVAHLSPLARKKLRITFKRLARLKAQAEPKIDIKPGDTVWASTDHHRPYEVLGIYTWNRSALNENCDAKKVWPDLETYHQQKITRLVDQEIASLSATARQLMGMKVKRG
jgi:hypothetical protein